MQWNCWKGTPCASAYTLQPQKIARTAGADTVTDWTDTNCIPDIAVCSDPHGIIWNETCETVDVCLHVTDSEVIAKMKGQTNLYARK
jgi:hypothetical protein